MKKAVLLIILVTLAATALAQTRPRLGILPFTGGTERDGETIATLFSLQDNIRDAFTVVPRTGAVNALVAEQEFQLSGYTDSDTISRLGHMLNADYVVSGHIRRFSGRNLVITTIVNVETFELVAGDYREYRNIEDIPSLLPAITGNMITAVQRGVPTLRLPNLAVAPFNITGARAGAQDAEVLANILAIEIVNTGKYTVLPRTATMQAALQELEFQMSGHTAEEEAKALGRAINAEFVLFAEARSLGNINMFIAQILHVEDGSQLAGESRNYQIIDDGMRLMPELARLLTDKAGLSAEMAEQQRARRRQARFWSIGATAGTSFTTPWVIGTVFTTLAPLPYSFLQIGFDYGMISGYEDIEFYSLNPFVHYAFFLPFKSKGGWYIGAGGGYYLPVYTFPDGKTSQDNFFTASIVTGFNIGNFLDISYTLRTNFAEISGKAAVGACFRFK